MRFENIVKMQEQLEATMVHTRERTREDIINSYRAELIEFLEETKFSHKTWKNKEYNKEKELEELVDGLFFISQLYIYDRDNGILKAENVDYWINPSFITYDDKDFYVRFDECMKSLGYFDFMIIRYFKLVSAMNYTKDEIYEAYKKKWEYNMNQRKDWIGR